MSRFTLSSTAKKNLDEIWDYIAIDNNSPVAASRQIEVLYEKFRLLATQPLLGQSRNDLADNVRLFAVRPFAIIYRPTSYGIDVLRVAHGAQDLYAIL